MKSDFEMRSHHV